ncbi:MAG: DUF2155 domain-containing protein [Nitrospirae bacterium]|nr:MAG: DUF2155 domain-containing protein [Nitrospirota bacterium]
MVRKILFAVMIVALVAAVGCKKKDEKPAPPQGAQQLPGGHPPVPGAPGGQQMPSGHPEMGQQMPGGAPPMPKAGTLKIVVPDSVKGKWSAVKLVIEDKASKKRQEHSVNLNSDFKVPNSNLTIKVGDFLPDFRMADTITSASNQLNNPAVYIKVTENNAEVFKGWLYSKFPTIHPFEHPKFGISLKEAVAKKG